MGASGTPGKPGWGGIVPTVLSVIATMSVAWFAFLGDKGSAQEGDMSERLGVAFSRMDDLERKMTGLRVELDACLLDNLELTTQVRSRTDPIQILQSYLDTFPEPAWIKEVHTNPQTGEVEFRMLVINRAYENEYGVSRFNYIGKTDFEIWPQAVAERFYSSDMIAYNTKRATKEVEAEFPESVDAGMEGTQIVRLIWKYATPLPGEKWGIGGHIMERGMKDADTIRVLRESIDRGVILEGLGRE